MTIGWYFKITDPHTIVHFVGCYALFMTAQLFCGCTTAFTIAVVAGAVWEVLDFLNREFDWDISFLDPRGGDFSDFVVDFLGAGLAWVVVGIAGLL